MNGSLTILDRARQLIERGYTPLPLNGKAPTVNGWQSLTVTADSLTEWQQSGKLHNLGLRTGDKGLIVLDFDGLSGYEAFCAGFPELIDTHTVKTGSGKGMHVYLTLLGELPRSSGQLNMPDGGFIEIKAKGRQVVIPPSVHPETKLPYEIHIAAPIKVITTFVPIQEWIDAFNPKPEYTPTPHQEAPPAALGEFEAYARSALNNMSAELARMGNVTDDSQNDTLNEMAWKLAHFVRRGDLSESECRNSLLGAMSANGYSAAFGARQAEKTFDSGFNRGYSDTSFEPEIYRRPTRNQWQGQKMPDRQMPGDWQAYEPPQSSVDQEGVTTIQRTQIIKRTSLINELSDRIAADEYRGTAPAIPFPLKCMHKFKGFALITPPGKVIGFVGSSGSGKTSALETIADAYLDYDIPVWMWSPEWTPDEMLVRAVQRHGGVTQDQLYLHEFDLWRSHHYNSPPSESMRLSEDTRAKSSLAIRKLRTWKQDVHFVNNELLTVDEMTEVIAAAKSSTAVFPRVLICDYAQLLEANQVNADQDSLYHMIHRFKRMCVRYGLVGILSTQTTKNDAREAQKGGEYKGTTVINCTKNSAGKPGKVRVKSDAERLRIIDEEYPDQTFDKDEFYLGSQAGRGITEHAFNLFITLNPEKFA